MTFDAHRTVEAVWRIESARIIGAVARMVRDIGLAEELPRMRCSLRWNTGLSQACPTFPAPGS